MLEFETVVVLIGLRSEADLFDNNLGGVGFLLLLTLFLLIQILLIVENATYRRVGRCADFYEIEFLFVGNAHGFLIRVDSLLYIIAYKSNFFYAANLIVDSVRHLFFAGATTVARTAGLRICYSLFPPILG